MDEKRKNFIYMLIDDFYNAAGQYTRLVNSQILIPVYNNLSIKDSHILVFIGRYPNINITELAAKFSVTKGAMSKTISRLVSRKYINKTTADESGREVKMSLTPKGFTVYELFENKAKLYRTKLYEALESVPLSHLMSTAIFLEELNKMFEDYSVFLDSSEKNSNFIQLSEENDESEN
ncbi:MAG: MarR family transcriptional regulator [Deltaproteobacteria bacterium]|jgi:DNA-binding MarR family transcriptional regulator|nr:MarR family transcriptional regulator [Deltaproteobacteria bacterium]